ncbi:MAG: hypothetical protein Q7T23_15200 [Phenylobacterium sp.]|nr:hypothetical protein [Phenylobacterium sp.]
MSRAVLNVLNPSMIVVSGLPWIAKGEERRIGSSSLVSKCLCKAHNSALSPLDQVGGKFFAAMKAGFLNEENVAQHWLFSGHDIERWMLKTLAAMANSESLQMSGERLSAKFHPTINLPDQIQDVGSWKPKVGLYCNHVVGDRIENINNISMWPLTNEGMEIIGIAMKIQGLELTLLAGDVDGLLRDGKPLGYRPGHFHFDHRGVVSAIDLSWRDANPHSTLIISAN